MNIPTPWECFKGACRNCNSSPVSKRYCEGGSPNPLSLNSESWYKTDRGIPSLAAPQHPLAKKGRYKCLFSHPASGHQLTSMTPVVTGHNHCIHFINSGRSDQWLQIGILLLYPQPAQTETGAAPLHLCPVSICSLYSLYFLLLVLLYSLYTLNTHTHKEAKSYWDRLSRLEKTTTKTRNTLMKLVICG